MIERRLAQMREEFDGAFSRPRAVRPARGRRLLLIEAAGRSWAVAEEDAGGLARCLLRTPLPGGDPALLGLAVRQGRLLAVYSLGRLLGGEAGEEPWVVLLREQPSLGLACAAYHGLREEQEALDGGMVRVDGALFPLVDTRSIVEALLKGEEKRE